MSVTVRLPGSLRDAVGGVTKLAAEGGTLDEIIGDIERRHPGFRSLVVDDAGRIKAYVNVYIGDEDARTHGGLSAPVRDGSEVMVIPAMAGGARPERLLLTPAQRDELVAHAAETTAEVCGVVVGRDDRASRVIRCRNVAEDPRASGGLRRSAETGYVIDPLQLRDIYDEIERTGERVLAYYHSHPAFAEGRPSHTDIRDARASGENAVSLFVIVHGTAVRAFAIDDDAREVPLAILVVAT
jgi:proteasome lid subunit RPN8/RPN11/molybdopterin converting factor small subunit